MIIIICNSGIELKYKGNILLAFEPELLIVKANYSENINGHHWGSDAWDMIYLKDIKQIKGIDK